MQLSSLKSWQNCLGVSVHKSRGLLALTGKPCVMGISILKMRTRALNRVQTRIGSLGSQNTQPILEGSSQKNMFEK